MTGFANVTELEDFMTVAQAAKELGMTPSGLRTAITEGRLRRTLLHARTSLIGAESAPFNIGLL